MAQTTGADFILSTYAEDENPGSSSLNNNWQALTTYLNSLQEQIRALTNQYVTQAALTSEANARVQADQDNYSTLNTAINGKASIGDLGDGHLGVALSGKVYDATGKVEVAGSNLATKAWVQTQGFQVGTAGDRPSMYMKVQVTFNDGGEYRSAMVWLRIEGGVITAWAPGVMSLPSVLSSEGNWLKSSIDPTLL
jgi:hypothetical protein